MKKDDIRQLQISRFNYILPDEKIAKYPLLQRDGSRLLLYNGGEISDTRFRELPGLLPRESLLLFNNTRVIHARLLFQRETGAQIEIFCLSPCDPADYIISFQQRESCTWHCMIGNARRWKEEALQMKIPVKEGMVRLTARKTGRHDDEVEVRFSWDDDRYTFSELLEIEVLKEVYPAACRQVHVAIAPFLDIGLGRRPLPCPLEIVWLDAPVVGPHERDLLRGEVVTDLRLSLIHI